MRLSEASGDVGIYVEGVNKRAVQEVCASILSILGAGRGIQVTVAALTALTSALNHPVQITSCNVQMGGKKGAKK